MDAWEDDSRLSSPSTSPGWPGSLPACSVCGRRDHTLRIASYPYVFSLVFLTFRRAFTGLWCARHARPWWLLAGLITATVGWIGFPFGLLFTPVALFRLACGGEQFPEENRSLLLSLAEHKLSQGDAEDAIRCLEAALQLGDDAAVHERLRSLYATHRFLSGTKRPRRAVPIVVALLCAGLAGLAAGAVARAVSTRLWSLFVDSESLLVLVLDWAPLFGLAFALALFLRWLIEWSLVAAGCRQALLAVAVALFAAGLAAYGLPTGGMLVQYVEVLQMGVAPLPAGEALWTAGGVLTRGGLLEVLGALLEGGVHLVYALVLLGAGLCYAGLGVDVALWVAGWQRRLAAIAREVSIESPASAAPGWLALASVALALVLAASLFPQQGLVDYMESFSIAWRGWELFEEEGPEAGLPDLERAVRLNPRSALARYSLGTVYYVQGRFEEAAAELEEAIRLNPGLIDAYRTLAWAYQGLDRVEDAIQCCREALRLDPSSALPHVALGFIYFGQEDYPAALEAFEAALELEPGHGEAQRGLGLAYSMQGAYDQALEPLQEAVRSDPEDAIARFHLGVLHRARGELDQAREQFTALAAIEPEWGLPHALLASVHYNLGRDELAEYELQKASALQSEDYPSMYTLALTYLGLYRLPEAEALLLRCVDLSPAPQEQYAQLGLLYALQERFDLALDMCARALELEEDSADFLVARADVYEVQGQYDLALADLERALELSPDDASAHSSLCFLYWRTGRLEEAVREGEEAVRLQPYDAGAQTGLALAYQAAGRLEPAVAVAQEAIRLSPRYDTPHYALGLCYAAAGDAAQATQEFQTFLDLYQDRPLAREYKAHAEAYLAGQAP